MADDHQEHTGSEDEQRRGHENGGEHTQRQQRRAFGAVARRARVVAGESVAGARQLEHDWSDQHQPDEHVLGTEVTQPHDRHALGGEQGREQKPP